MIVEMQHDQLTAQDAQDTIAGWKGMPTFVLGYVRVPPKDSVTPFYAVGLFDIAEGDIVRGQRLATDVSLGSSGKPFGEGLAAIVTERVRQIFSEGFTVEHDASHKDESMATVAALYAAPEEIYVLDHSTSESECGPPNYTFKDPWPKSWDNSWDKRGEHDRVKQLAVAGALCAAEIDRLKARGEGS